LLRCAAVSPPRVWNELASSDDHWVALWPGGACERSPPRADQHERTLLRSAKDAGLSVEGVLPSMLCPCPFHDAATADYSMYWQLSQIWSWDTSQVGPFGLFPAIGLYGEIPVHRSQVQLIAFARRVHRSVLDVDVGYVSGRQTICRGSLGRDNDVCSMLFPLWFNYSHLSALWSSPCI
jgi:hypothetical protein